MRQSSLVAALSIFLFYAATAESAPAEKLPTFTNLEKCLPVVKIPAKLGVPDEKALHVMSSASVLPVTKGLFPDYRPVSSGEGDRQISSWTLADYKAILRLKAISQELSQLTSDQLFQMDSMFGGNYNHGVMLNLRARAETGIEIYSNGVGLSGDNVDSALAAAPASWTAFITRAKSIRGNRAEAYDIAKLKSQYGEGPTKKFLEDFARLEREKGRPHEVWLFGLRESGWIDSLYNLKKQLKSLGYDAFARETESKRLLFPTLADAQKFAKTLNAGITPNVLNEGPAELIIDSKADVISVSGKVVRRELDPASKERVQQLQGLSNFMKPIANLFGGTRGFKIPDKMIGPTFQFADYPTNWIPPQSIIETLPDNTVKISVPDRYSVSYKYHEAFAIKNMDQWRYLVVQGLDAINYGMSGPQVIGQLKNWDSLYGLSVLEARFDSVQAKLDRSPPNPQEFVKLEKEFCPDIDGPGDLQKLINHRYVDLWWD